MTIAAILDNKGTDVVTLDVDTPVHEAVALLADRKIGAMPVTRDGTICGILSERDVIGCLSRDGGCTLDWTVERLMSSPAITVTRGNTVEEAMGLMTRKRIRHLPVVESEELVGIVSIGDLVKARIADAEAEADAMREYIQAT